MLDRLRRCSPLVSLLLLGACNAPPLVPPPEACEASTFTTRLRTGVQTTTVIFVLDDSGALEPQSASVRRAILDAARRFVDLTCDVDAALGGADCETGALDRKHYEDLGFVVLLGGYDACGEGSTQPLGRVLVSDAAPTAVFEWRPSELVELSDAGHALGKLLRDLDHALATVEYSSCHVPQPLEAVYELLAKPEPPLAVERFRAHTANDYLQIVMLLGSDDQSGWPGAPYPVERYVNLLYSKEDGLCHDDLSLSWTRCAQPMPNPIRSRASLTLVGPEASMLPQCELMDPVEANTWLRAWKAPSARVEQVVETVGFGRFNSQPWCFEANAAPDSPQFLFPTFYDHGVKLSHGEPLMCLPNRLAFEEDPDSPAFGQASCIAVEAHSGDDPTQCACEGSHRAPLRDEVRDVFERLAPVGAGEFACYCELFQFSGPELWDCHHVDTPGALEQEPSGYCLIDPGQGFGDASRAEYCSESQRRVLRFLGRDVPVPGSDVFLTCGREECDSNSEDNALDTISK